MAVLMLLTDSPSAAMLLEDIGAGLTLDNETPASGITIGDVGATLSLGDLP